jgi:signal transduction histidine kinase
VAPPPSVHTPRVKRQAILSFAFLTIASAPLDWLVAGRFTPGPLAIRVGWALALAAVTLTSLCDSRSRLLARGLSLTSPALLALVVLATGVRESPVAWLLLAVPTPLAALSDRDPVAFALGAGSTVVAGVGLSLWQDPSPLRLAIWLALLAATVALSFLATKVLSEAHDAREAAETGRQRTEERLQEAERVRAGTERLALLGQLAAGVAHEINNPLACVSGNLEELQQKEDDPARTQILGDAMNAVGRICQIVSDLRRFSRADSAPPQSARCHVATVADEALRLSAHKLRRVGKAEKAIPADLPEAAISPQRLAQVLVNLLVNSADALEAAGRRNGQVRLVARAEPEAIEIAIEDDGPGVAPEVASHLFELFFTTKPVDQGTGLGLAVSRKYVEGVGGSLRAEKRDGGGARFVVRLRRAGVGAREV